MTITTSTPERVIPAVLALLSQKKSGLQPDGSIRILHLTTLDKSDQFKNMNELSTITAGVKSVLRVGYLS